MAKRISYKYLAYEINHGTEDIPKIEQIFDDKFFICPTQESYEKMYSFAESEAVGNIIVDGEFDEIDNTPSQLDIIEAQVTYTAMMTDTLLEV